MNGYEGHAQAAHKRDGIRGGAGQELGIGCRIIAQAFDDTWHEICERKHRQADAKAQDTRQVHALISTRSQNLLVPWWRRRLALAL